MRDHSISLENLDIYSLAYGDPKLEKRLNLEILRFKSIVAAHIETLTPVELRILTDTLIKGRLSRPWAKRTFWLFNRTLHKFYDLSNVYKTRFDVDKNLVKDINATKTHRELFELLDGRSEYNGVDYLAKAIIEKGVNAIKKTYIQSKEDGDVIDLRVLTLNTFLLHVGKLKSSDIKLRARTIGNAIAAMNPPPDIILLQEVFPKDSNHVKEEKFKWPASEDWPMRDLKTILSMLNQNSRNNYSQVIMGHKQVGANYKSIGETFSSIFRGNDVKAALSDHPYDGLNLGPPGLVIIASDKVRGTKLSQKWGWLKVKEETPAEYELKNLGSFFSRYDKDTGLNRMLPLSRGLLSGLFAIKGVGVFDVSTTHMNTESDKNLDRVYQTSRWLEDKSKLNLNPQKFATDLIKKFTLNLCTMHRSPECPSVDEISASSGIDLVNLLPQLQEDIIDEAKLTVREISDIQNYFETLLNPSFKSQHLFGVFGGDFNYQPYGKHMGEDETRVAEKWPFRLLLDDSSVYSVLHSGEQGKNKFTYDVTGNIRASESSTPVSTQLTKLLEPVILNFFSEKKEQAKAALQKWVKAMLPDESSSDRKLDYLLLNEHSVGHSGARNTVVAIDQGKVVFKNPEAHTEKEDPQVSDHYGLVMDLKIYKSNGL